MASQNTLDQHDDPDRQIPMPFAAAESYARQVMAWSREPLPAQVMATRDVAYGEHRLHRYDVFAPIEVQNAPVLVFWHGGGWTNGYRAYNHFMARHIVAMGCMLVTPSYRLVTEARFPAAYDDAVAALAHLRENLPTLGGAADRIHLAGHSAGGHLAALVALRANATTAPVQGCLPISGIMDLHHPNPQPGSLEERVYSMVLQRPEQDGGMSPVNHTQGNRVPFVLTCGEHDSERVRVSNRRLFELLSLQQGKVAIQEMPGEDHFQTHTSLHQRGNPWYAALQNMMASPG
jgi:acetyl esterase/lipase